MPIDILPKVVMQSIWKEIDMPLNVNDERYLSIT